MVVSQLDEETADALGISQDELRRLQDKMFRSVVLALEYDINDGEEDLTLVEVLTDDMATVHVPLRCLLDAPFEVQPVRTRSPR